MSVGWSWIALASAMGHEGATQVLEDHVGECFKNWKPVDSLKAENPMDEPIPDLLIKVADVLHFLGRYRESNVLILLSRWLRARGIDTDDRLQFAMLAAEEDAHRSASTARSYDAAQRDASITVEEFKRATGPDAYAPQSTEPKERP